MFGKPKTINLPPSQHGQGNGDDGAREEHIIKQSILKANTFRDFNKLFNLFHFLKLKIDLTASRPQRRV